MNDMRALNVEGASLLTPDAGDMPAAYLIGAEAGELSEIAPLLTAPVALIGVEIADWNAELSPWYAPGLGIGEAFSGKLDDTVARLSEKIMPRCEEALHSNGVSVAYRLAVGYSMGGLGAMYSACKLAAFCGVASVSGSLWFDGFIDYLRANPPKVSAAYFSLGDREPRARNQRLAKVGEATLAAREIVMSAQINSIFEWNQGNHFMNVPQRIAKGINWLCANAGNI